MRAFLEFAKNDAAETCFDFDRFAPYPPEWGEMDRANDEWWERGDLSTDPPPSAFGLWGSDWCNEHWGTPGNARDAEYDRVTERDGQLAASVCFLTAWSPPKPLVLTASNLFPDLQFELRYFEPLGDADGMFRCEGGVATLDECRPCVHTLVGDE